MRRFRGAYLLPSGRWAAAVQAAGVQHHLGVFDTEEEAGAAAAAGRERLQGEHRARRTNRAWIVGDVAYLEVGTPKFPRAISLIDAADLAHVSDGQGRWLATQTNAVTVYVVRGDDTYLHRHILRLRPGSRQVADHANHDGLDNRRANLRVATVLQNVANSRRGQAGRIGIRQRTSGRWTARIKTQSGSALHLGTFDTPEEAARAYDRAARERYGEFALLNFPEGRSA